MKVLLTLSALALTLPAVGLAGSPTDSRHDKDQQQKQQSRNAEQMQQGLGQAERADQQPGQQGVRQSERATQQRAQQAAQRTSQDRLTRLEPNHITLGDLKGTTILNRQNEEVGTLSDVILDQEGRVAAVIVTTGGLMGIGKTSRAISWDDVQVRAKSNTDDEYNVVINLSKQEVDNLAEFNTRRRTTTVGR